MKYTRKRRRAKRRTKLRGGDPRYSWFPGPVSDLVSSLRYSLSSANATLTGSYPTVNPNWRIQPALNIR
jgi:hypothetical protein